MTPYVSWEGFDDGPSFVGAPLMPYRLGDGGDVRIPQPNGTLLEIPMSIGFSRTPFGVWSGFRQLLASPVLRPLHLAGLAARVGLIKRIFLSPEMHRRVGLGAGLSEEEYEQVRRNSETLLEKLRPREL